LDGLLLGERSAEILATASEPVTSRRMAEVIATAAGKAADVVRSLRSWLGQSPPIEARPVDIVKDIEIVLTLMNGSMKGGVRIERDFSKAWVLGSSEQLSQVWMNLVRNAAQAMGFEGEILLRTECVDDKVIVTIVDSGPGIPGTIRSQIFDPFFTTKVDGEGMGLGLDICKRIIEAHSGSIALDSRPGRTEFRVTLPAYEG
jgi:signal transduction histidine kinase